MKNYEVLRGLILTRKITRINQILKFGTPVFWSQVLHIGESNAKKKIEKKGTTMILRDALALAAFFEVDPDTIVEMFVITSLNVILNFYFYRDLLYPPPEGDIYCCLVFFRLQPTFTGEFSFPHII